MRFNKLGLQSELKFHSLLGSCAGSMSAVKAWVVSLMRGWEIELSSRAFSEHAQSLGFDTQHCCRSEGPYASSLLLKMFMTSALHSRCSTCASTASIPNPKQKWIVWLLLWRNCLLHFSLALLWALSTHMAFGRSLFFLLPFLLLQYFKGAVYNGYKDGKTKEQEECLVPDSAPGLLQQSCPLCHPPFSQQALSPSSFLGRKGILQWMCPVSICTASN